MVSSLSIPEKKHVLDRPRPNRFRGILLEKKKYIGSGAPLFALKTQGDYSRVFIFPEKESTHFPISWDLTRYWGLSLAKVQQTFETTATIVETKAKALLPSKRIQNENQ